jgi:hypothetical protein
VVTVSARSYEVLRRDNEALRGQLAAANERVAALTVEVGRLADRRQLLLPHADN